MAGPAGALLALQRHGGNAAATAAVQRHAAAGLHNSSGGGGLSNLIFTKEDGTQLVGDLSFGRASMDLTEQGATRAGTPHDPPGRFNTMAHGGFANVTLTPEDGGGITGALEFLKGRLSGLVEVQRHAAPGTDNRFGPGGFSDAIFTPDDGRPQLVGAISFQSGRMRGLTEHGGPGPKPPVGQRLLSQAMGSQGEDVRRLQQKLDAAAGDDLVADSIFGPLTDAATRRFQTSRGLIPDGIVGPRTRGALGL